MIPAPAPRPPLRSSGRSRGLILLLSLLLCACAAVQEKNRAAVLDLHLIRFEKALRWHDHAQVAGYLRRKDDVPVEWVPPPEQVRITAYEIQSLNIDPDTSHAVARVAIDYYYSDELKVRSVDYLQQWWYDPERRRWWIENAPPPFPRNPRATDRRVP